jgi:hypothetical protein
MEPKKHLKLVLFITALLLVIATYIYVSSCQPTYMIGLCSAIRLTRVSFVVLTTLNFLILSAALYKLVLEKIKHPDTIHLFIYYASSFVVSLGIALFQMNIFTTLKFID